MLGFEKGDRSYWRWIGTVSSVAAMLIYTLSIWELVWFTHADHPPLVGSIFGAIAVVVAYACLVFYPRLRGWHAIVTFGGIVLAATTAALGVVMSNLVNTSTDIEFIGRLTGAFGIGSLAALLAVGILVLINRPVQKQPRKHEFKEITLLCPRCGLKQTGGFQPQSGRLTVPQASESCIQ